MKRLFGCAVVLSLVLGATLAADVQTQQKSQMKFEGVLGKMFGLFGGKAAKEGLVQTIAVSGDRKVTTSENTAQIVDLAEEKIYDLDLRNKSYKVTTFEQLRKQMQEAAAKAQKSERKSNEPQKEYETDMDVKDTGQRKAVNGFDCGQTIVTITVHEKGKTVEQAGGVILTADVWATKAVPALKEMTDFDRKYAEKLLGGDTAQQMATAMAMFPGMKDAMAKWQANGSKMEGTPIQTTVTFASAPTAEQQQQASEQKASEPKGDQGSMGMLGGLGRRFGRKKDDQPAAASGDKSRATIMTMVSEIMSVSTSVDKGTLAVPAGFKQK